MRPRRKYFGPLASSHYETSDFNVEQAQWKRRRIGLAILSVASILSVTIASSSVIKNRTGDVLYLPLAKTGKVQNTIGRTSLLTFIHKTMSGTRPNKVKRCSQVDVLESQTSSYFGSKEEMEKLIPEWLKGFRTMKEEFDIKLEGSNVRGQIPSDIEEGVLYRNGPAIMETVGGERLNQPFDGDGMVAKFVLNAEDNSVHFTNRVILTQHLKEELEAGRTLYSSAFSSGNPSRERGNRLALPFSLDFKNVANTHLLHWNRKLWALWEGGPPHRLDPDTLDTEGMDELGILKGESPFAAHYRIFEEDDGRRTLINFGAGQKGVDLNLKIWEFDENTMQPKKERVINLKKKGFAFLHDFVVTKDHYVFHMNPLSLDLKKVGREFLLGKCAIAQCLKFNPAEKGVWLIVPRDPEKPFREIEAPTSQFVFHHGNAYIDNDGKDIIVDSVTLNSFDFNANVDTISADYFSSPGAWSRLQRNIINLESGTVVQKVISNRGCEFPSILPSKVGKKHKYIYTACSAAPDIEGWGPNRALRKTEMETGEDDIYIFGDRSFPGEPVFVPRKNAKSEDDGYVMIVVYDSEKDHSCLAILDATNIKDGPVAEVQLPVMLPYGLHGAWVPRSHM
eukprot:CAMPEP_0184482932 /NCGR_PEP_ID=MMETSP0113_2-20130426/4535_1 /TAXON_ID=91329 /ORGANISM="Norrisiella sphaerica, Strain BC52" /LENGTH=620 /DNA_ID=CAMNT_0026862987 /DNA_START=76 /DNA_END=1938 /DNA_ORIENTATION=+